MKLISKKLLRPCKYIVLRIFKLRLRKCLSIKFQPRKQQAQHQHLTTDKDLSTKKIVSFKSVLHLLRFRKKSQDIVQMDRLSSENSCVRPKTKITSASTNYVTTGSENQDKYSCGRTTGSSTNVFTGAGKEECSEQVEEACRSFQNYLAEMIVEEGRTEDLMDVEQLLYCWNNLRCPVFIHLLSTFYGELCMDLFSKP